MHNSNYFKEQKFLKSEVKNDDMINKELSVVNLFLSNYLYTLLIRLIKTSYLMVLQHNILMKLSIKADSKIYIKFLFNK